MEEIEKMPEYKDLSLRQKVAIKSVKWTQRIAVKKASKDITKLYMKHEQLLNNLMDDVADFVALEDDKLSPQMATILCTNIISGFDTQKEMSLVQEMISTTLKEYNKVNNTPEE